MCESEKKKKTHTRKGGSRLAGCEGEFRVCVLGLLAHVVRPGLHELVGGAARQVRVCGPRVHDRALARGEDRRVDAYAPRRPLEKRGVAFFFFSRSAGGRVF